MRAHKSVVCLVSWMVSLCLLLFVAACTDGTIEATDGQSSDGTPAPAGADSGHQPAYEIEDGSQADAQRQLDAAEGAFLAVPRGHYRVEWELDSIPLVITGEFDLDDSLGRQVAFMGHDNYIETLMVANDAWGRPTSGGVSGECWIHMSVGDADGAGAGGALPGVYPLIEPQAVGFLKGEGSERIVVELLLDEAVAIASPKMGTQLQAQIRPDATIPALVTLDDGRYRALEYSMVDVVAALDGVGSGPLDALRGAVGGEGDVPVRVDYAKWGVNVAVEAPAPETVIDAGSRDEVLQNADSSPDAELPACEAAHQ